MTDLPLNPMYLELNQPQSSNPHQQTYINHNSNAIINSTEHAPPSTSLTKSGKFGLCFIIVFVGLILTTIFLVLFYQQKPKPKDQNAEEQTIIDEPYKVGDEVVQNYDLVLLNTTKALCLDGSPGSYYESRTGDPSRILLFFEGGGWCFGDDDLSVLRHCLGRSKHFLGSSNLRSLTMFNTENVLSKHPNNYFRNWKKIFLNYCDGSGHQGSVKDPVNIDGQQIYFRGHDIKVETFEDLERKYGMFSKAARVVVSGWSAGALAVFTWANYIYDRVQNGRVFAIPDAGIFYDAQDKNTGQHTFKQRLKNLMKFTNSQMDPPTPECLQEHPNQKVNCMFAQYLYKHIKPRLFVVNSLTDTFSLPNILGVGCLRMSSCSPDDNQIVETNRVNLTNIVKEIVSDKKNGAFVTSCPLHEILIATRFTDENVKIPLNSGFTASKAIEQWFRYPKLDNLHLDLDSWPNNNAGCV